MIIRNRLFSSYPARFAFLAILSVLTFDALAAVYKWVDDDGRVHFSDQPEPGAQRIDIPEAGQPQPRSEKSRPSIPGETQTGKTAIEKYRLFRITSPAQNQTVRNNQGDVAIAFDLDPALQEGHVIQLFVDGLKIKDEFSSLSALIRDLERGTHTFRAVVKDASQRTLISSDTIRFHLHRETDHVQDHIAPPEDKEKAFVPRYPETPKGEGEFPETPKGEGEFPETPKGAGKFPKVPEGKGLYPTTPGGSYKKDAAPAFKPGFQQKP